jgi:hypothetical protein
MKPLHRGILVAVLQCLLVLSLAGKYAWDRGRLPRVWVKTAPGDPFLPIRGRYVRLRLEVAVTPVAGARDIGTFSPVELRIRNGQLAATPTSRFTGVNVMHWPGGDWVLNEPVAFFIPEHAADPARLAPGQELWAEVSVPGRGPPRPIRLGVKKDGVLTPLAVQ